jgi:hypothetical protein
MHVDDIADLRALKPWAALSITMERRAIRLGKLVAGELFLHRERVRHAVALLQVIADEYFRERPSLIRDLVWAVSEFEEMERCEIAGAAIFVAFAEGRAKDDNQVAAVTNSLLDQLALIRQHALEAMPNANLQLPFNQQSQSGPVDSNPNADSQRSAQILAENSGTTNPDRPVVGTVNASADDPRDRTLALLKAAAVNGKVNICPRGAAPFVIDLPNTQASHSRSYRGTLKVEGQVDGLRWHNLAFSVHGAPLLDPNAANDANSGKRFFSGKVDAKIFLKLLPHFVDRSVCVFELHEFVDPLGMPGKGSTYELSSFEFVRKMDTGLFA